MDHKSKQHFDVVAALIEQGGKYLACQRLSEDYFGSMWEFPGGKVEEGEEKENALKREIKEELGIEIEMHGLARTFEDEIPSLKITVYLYKVSVLKGNPERVECQDFISLDFMIRWDLKLTNLLTCQTLLILNLPLKDRSLM